MLSYAHAAILGLVEGLTEFVPVSSSAHLIIARSIFNIHGNDLSIDAVLQFATILALIIYFFSDLWHLLRAAVRWVARRIVSEEDKKMILAIIIGTIPAAVLGLLLEKTMETTFRSVRLVAWMLIVGAALMLFAEWKAKQKTKEVNVKKGFVVGLFQTLALVPGISRSGSTISGGLLTGLERETATRFSFLLSVPIILGSGLKMLLDLYKSGGIIAGGVLPLGLGFAVAFITGLISIHFLITYLKKHDLKIFVWYRVVLAILVLILLKG